MSQSKFSHRSAGIEIMDDLNCSGEVVHQTLRELEFINQTLGGNAVTVTGVKQLLKENQRESIQGISKNSLYPSPPEKGEGLRPDKEIVFRDVLHILDLGCGGGDLLKLLKNRIKITATGKGIDANPHIVEYAQQHNHDPAISFAAMDILSDEFKRESCDVAIGTLFFHHFSDSQLVEIFSHLKNQARIGIVINDLHRHPLAYHSIKLLTRLFSKSSMVKYDAPLSVLRGFSRKELVSILKQAGIENYSLTWKWAFRWQIVINTAN
jgi:2-polyprenyl-3-methyl-5-hydroxy-6-metoxy-1,4-benzoquinol methylase